MTDAKDLMSMGNTLSVASMSVLLVSIHGCVAVLVLVRVCMVAMWLCGYAGVEWCVGVVGRNKPCKRLPSA